MLQFSEISLKPLPSLKIPAPPSFGPPQGKHGAALPILADGEGIQISRRARRKMRSESSKRMAWPDPD
jgi:hypothetical protein